MSGKLIAISLLIKCWTTLHTAAATPTMGKMMFLNHIVGNVNGQSLLQSKLADMTQSHDHEFHCVR